MASKYWIKLYHEILDDAKMGKLSDRLWRRAIELFLLAGDSDSEGQLPSLENIAWRLRISEEEILSDLQALAEPGVNIIERWSDCWAVTKFEDRQAPIPAEERSRQFRDRERKENYYETETERNANEERTQTERNVRGSDIGTNTEENTEAERKPNETFVDTDKIQIRTDTDKIQTTTESDAEKKKSVAAVKILLADFGVEEPWVSDLAMMCSEETVRGWIAYVNGRDGVTNPAGFLISRLRTGESPPVGKETTWFTGDDFKKYFVQPGEMPETKGN